MKLSRILIIAVLVALLIVGYQLYRYLSYGSVLDKAEEKWLSQTFVPSKIVGIIYELNEPYGDDCFSNLIIKQVDGERLSSGVCICDSNTDFGRFALAGDSVFKESGSKRILIKKSNGDAKEFDFPFCKD